MKVMFDTSVLVASLVKAHPLHRRAAGWHRRALGSEVGFFVAGHAVLELYAVLTRLPLRPSIQPAVAWKLIRDNIASAADIIALTDAEYLSTVEAVSALGLTGGIVYDALVARAAESAEVDVLLTFNTGHFRRVWPAGGERIRTP